MPCSSSYSRARSIDTLARPAISDARARSSSSKVRSGRAPREHQPGDDPVAREQRNADDRPEGVLRLVAAQIRSDDVGERQRDVADDELRPTVDEQPVDVARRAPRRAMSLPAPPGSGLGVAVGDRDDLEHGGIVDHPHDRRDVGELGNEEAREPTGALLGAIGHVELGAHFREQIGTRPRRVLAGDQPRPREGLRRVVGQTAEQRPIIGVDLPSTVEAHQQHGRGTVDVDPQQRRFDWLAPRRSRRRGRRLVTAMAERSPPGRASVSRPTGGSPAVAITDEPSVDRARVAAHLAPSSSLAAVATTAPIDSASTAARRAAAVSRRRSAVRRRRSSSAW